MGFTCCIDYGRRTCHELILLSGISKHSVCRDVLVVYKKLQLHAILICCWYRKPRSAWVVGGTGNLYNTDIGVSHHTTASKLGRSIYSVIVWQGSEPFDVFALYIGYILTCVIRSTIEPYSLCNKIFRTCSIIMAQVSCQVLDLKHASVIMIVLIMISVDGCTKMRNPA